MARKQGVINTINRVFHSFGCLRTCISCLAGRPWIFSFLKKMQIFYDIENFVQNRMKSCGNKDVSAYRHCFVCRIVQCGERASFIENIFGPDSEVGLLLQCEFAQWFHSPKDRRWFAPGAVFYRIRGRKGQVDRMRFPAKIWRWHWCYNIYGSAQQ